MTYVESVRELAAVTRAVQGAELIAIDTEAAGYHRYHDRVCLLQLSTREDTYVIDTLAVRELDPLAIVFEDPGVEVVIHDADYDLRLLGRDHGLRVAQLFDTKIAAQFVGEPAIGLANLVEKHLGVRLDKKFQRADWAHRPLSREQLAYAAEDTRHLPNLRDRMRATLEELGRLGWAEEEFRLREDMPTAVDAEDPDPWLRLKNTRDLTPRQLAALRELHEWRERAAEEKDVAPFRVLGNDALVAVARALPGSAAALARIPGLAASVQARRGEALLGAIERAKALSDKQLPRRPPSRRRPPPDPDFEQLVDRLKAVRDRVADALGIDRGFLMPRQQLEGIARSRPATLEELAALPDTRRWQVEALGERLLAELVAR